MAAERSSRKVRTAPRTRWATPDGLVDNLTSRSHVIRLPDDERPPARVGRGASVSWWGYWLQRTVPVGGVPGLSEPFWSVPRFQTLKKIGLVPGPAWFRA